jgi:hypothetical protein
LYQQRNGNVQFRASYRTAPRLNKPSNDTALMHAVAGCATAVSPRKIYSRGPAAQRCRHVTIIELP